jgi:hypothetical protein
MLLLRHVASWISCAVLMFGCIFGAATPVSAAVHYVKHDAGGNNDGTTWMHAYTSLQMALSNASAGDEIRVARGMYKPHASDETVSFVLDKHGLILRGGYEGVHPGGNPANGPGRRAPGSSSFLTILSGDIDGDTFVDADNSRHVVRVAGPFPGAQADAIEHVQLNGFVITHGYADGTTGTDDSRGGGLLVTHDVQGEDDDGSTAIRLIYCIVNNNIAEVGGGLYVRNGGDSGNPVRIISCTFGSTIDGNLAHIVSQNGGVGGGLAVIGDTTVGTGTTKGHVAILNSLLANNTAHKSGGGAWFGDDSTITMTSVTVAENVAGTALDEGYGGGIFEEKADSVSAVNGIFWGNYADTDAQISGNPTVTYSDVEGGYPGTGNVDTDPGFRTIAAAPTFHLDYASNVLHIGQDSDTSAPNIPTDSFDVDDDGSTSERTPTGARQPRLRGASGGAIVVDMGYSEVQGLCDGDCAGFDGHVNISDQLALLGDWGKGGACDIDLDGEVDVSDLNLLLAAWGDCPGAESMSGGDQELLETIVAFIDSVGGANNATVPLIIEFILHLQ